MKTLFLVRHAKTSWDDASLPDPERPLEERGRRDAAKMGKRMAKHAAKPDLIMSSPALRALATTEILARRLNYKRKHIVVSERLYGTQVDDLLAVIQKFGDKRKRLMLVGHNPELTELALQLSGKIGLMPTCAIAEFRFAVKSWSKIGRTKPTQAILHAPRKPRDRSATGKPRP